MGSLRNEESYPGNATASLISGVVVGTFHIHRVWSAGSQTSFSIGCPGPARSAHLRTATGGTVPLHCSRSFDASNENAAQDGALRHRVTFGPSVACTASARAH